MSLHARRASPPATWPESRIEEIHGTPFLMLRIRTPEATKNNSHDVQKLTPVENESKVQNRNDDCELPAPATPNLSATLPDEGERHKTQTATEARLKEVEVALAASESAVIELKDLVHRAESINDSQSEVTVDLKAKIAKLIEREQTSESYIAELESRLAQSFDIQKSDLHQANEYRLKLSKLRDVEKITEAYVSTLESMLANAESTISEHLQTVSRLESELQETKNIVELQANSISDLEGKTSSLNVKESSGDDANKDLGNNDSNETALHTTRNNPIGTEHTAEQINSSTNEITKQVDLNENEVQSKDTDRSNTTEEGTPNKQSSQELMFSKTPTPKEPVKAVAKDSGYHTGKLMRDDVKRRRNSMGRRASISGFDAEKLFPGYEGDSPDFRARERTVDFSSPHDYYGQLREAAQITNGVRFDEKYRIRLAVEEYRNRILHLKQEVASLRQQLDDAAARPEAHGLHVRHVESHNSEQTIAPLGAEIGQVIPVENHFQTIDGLSDDEDCLIADTTTDTFRTASEGGEIGASEEGTSAGITAIRKRLYATMEENNDLQCRLKDNEYFINRLTAENEALTADISDLRVRLEEIMPVIADMEEQVQNGPARLLEEARNEKAEQLSTVIKEQEERLRNAFQIEREDQAEQLREMSDTIKEMESRIKNSVDAEETANRLLEDRETQVQMLQAAIAKLKAETAKSSDSEFPQNTEILTLESRSRRSLVVPPSSGQGELAAIFQRRLSAGNQSDVVENAPTPPNSESMHAMNSLKDQVLELKAELKAVKTQFTAISTENEKLRREGMKEAKVILDDWKKTKEEMESVVEKLSSTESKVLDLESTVSQEKESFKRLGKEKEAAELSLRAEIAELEAKLEAEAEIIQKVEAEKAEIVENWEVSQLQNRKSEALSRTQIEQLESELNLSHSQLNLMDVSGIEQENVKAARSKKSEARILKLESEQRASSELIAQLQSSLHAAEEKNRKRESSRRKKESKRSSAKEAEQTRISKLNETEKKPDSPHNNGNGSILDTNMPYTTANPQMDASPMVESEGTEREQSLRIQAPPARRRSKGIFCCTAGDV